MEELDEAEIADEATLGTSESLEADHANPPGAEAAGGKAPNATARARRSSSSTTRLPLDLQTLRSIEAVATGGRLARPSSWLLAARACDSSLLALIPLAYVRRADGDHAAGAAVSDRRVTSRQRVTRERSSSQP
jgi:hypothetical protein